uniref:Uncharacterized protein n=1 Tax=Oryza glumipatula TaxID=40148 RepID=A0A0D9ZYT1_9ORYZ
MRCRRWRLARQAVAIGQRSLAVRRDVDQKSGPVWLIGFIRASDRCYQILFGKAEVALRFVTKIWESCDSTTAFDDCLRLLRGERDEQKLAGLREIEAVAGPLFDAARLPAHGLCELLIPDEHVADVVELVLLDGDELPAHGLGERGHGLPDLDVLGELLVHGRGGPDEEAAGAEDAVELEEEGAVSVSRAVPSSTRRRGDDTGGRRARARRRASGTRRWRPSGRWRCSRSPWSRRGRQRRRTGAARTGSGAPREAAGGAGAVTGMLPERVAALESLMLVQALECYFELAVAEGRAFGAVLDGGPS